MATKYRVTWRAFRKTAREQLATGDYSMEEHDIVYDDIEQGWDVYQRMQKKAFGATWEHVSEEGDHG